jgi:hypothetical protein
MPWETGFMDGLKSKVAICPFIDNSNTEEFIGQEYLGIYPYVTYAPTTTSPIPYLWIQTNSYTYVSFDKWLLPK